MPADKREACGEIKNLFRDIQNLLPRLLLLDRENQQEMLRRGLIPATQLPPVASQRPNFVANLYRRHTAV
jgi:DNA-directed RNA polymerase subunit H (RpoH/RPB5)